MPWGGGGRRACGRRAGPPPAAPPDTSAASSQSSPTCVPERGMGQRCEVLVKRERKRKREGVLGEVREEGGKEDD